jgi:hypothetical protein
MSIQLIRRSELAKIHRQNGTKSFRQLAGFPGSGEDKQKAEDGNSAKVT